ncbi:MAG: Hsp33 family molecular chaperone HslO [Desulfobacterales bacterium]|nr:MAG: Hsp33 family molecular chaperone HslO [Desulfobacterales bacterium]
MIKKEPYGKTLKDQLLAGAKDRLYNFLLANGAIRGVIMNGTRMVNEMRANHELGILETLVLGRAYLGAGLMSADLKSADRLSIKIDCSGPIKGLVAESNAFGEVRGFLQNVPIPIDKPMESFDLSPFFGAGFLEVTKHLEDAKQPFTGKVALKYGNIAQDLANYYLTSEQIPTAFNLSIKFDRDGNVTGAGGLFLQAMPEAREELTMDLENRVKNLPSLGDIFTEDKDPESLVRDVFQKHAPRFLSNRRIEFMCHCNKERLRSYLTLLPIDELKDIRENGPFPLEMRCHHCNTVYSFKKSAIMEIYGKRFPDN